MDGRTSIRPAHCISFRPNKYGLSCYFNTFKMNKSGELKIGFFLERNIANIEGSTWSTTGILKSLLHAKHHSKHTGHAGCGTHGYQKYQSWRKFLQESIPLRLGYTFWNARFVCDKFPQIIEKGHFLPTIISQASKQEGFVLVSPHCGHISAGRNAPR